MSLKNAPPPHFSNIEYLPHTFTRKKKANVQNYNHSRIQIHLNLFSSFTTLEPLFWNPKPEKAHQMETTRDHRGYFLVLKRL